MALSVAAALPSLSRLALAQSGQVNVYNWDTYIGETTLDDFTEATGIGVRYDLYANNDELFAKMREGNPGYDVIFPTNDYVERMIAADVTRMMQHSIENGVPFSMGNLQIHAERVYNVHPVPAHEATVPGAELQTRLLLARVAVVEVDRDGRVDSGGTAEHAVMDIYRVDADTYVKLAAGESVGGDATQWGGLGAGELPQAIVIPSLLRDNLRAKTKAQLLEIRDDPERHSAVRDAKEALARAIMDDRIYSTIDQRLREKGVRITLLSETQFWKLASPALRRSRA